MLNPEDPAVRAAVLGKQIEEFINNDIGRYLTKRSDEEVQECLHKLKNINPLTPEGARAIAGLQFQIRVAERVIHWLAEAIHEGHQAMNVLEDKHD